MRLRAAWAAPITSPPIRDAVVGFDGDVITEITSYDPARHKAAELTDLGACVITPGLVNPHAHLDFTCYAGKCAPAPLWEWFGQILPHRSEPGAIERELHAAADGAWQCLRAGVTTVGDWSQRAGVADALREVPIRKVCFLTLVSVASKPPRTPAELRAGLDAIAEDALTTRGVGVHSPYTVTPEHIRAAIELAAELDLPWSMHWAETREELAFLAGDEAALPEIMRAALERLPFGSPRCDACELLMRCTDGLPPGLLAHMYYFDQPEWIDWLGRSGHAVAYCPRAHRFYQHPPHPFRRFMAAGTPMVIGTDSAASNENLALLEELRFVGDAVSDAPTPTELLRMITLDAARVLRLGHRVGSLEIGKQADLAAFPCARDASDVIGDLVAAAPAPSAVWVAGRRVV